MAELEESGDIHSERGKKRGGVRAKKMSTRIDMTPMVDLGFLLVTFFILTTTMQRPVAMQIVMPDKDKIIDTTKVRESEATTLLLGGNNRIYYYNGITDPKVEVTNYVDVRKFLVERNQEVLDIQGQNGWNKAGVIVLIKAMNESKYQNLVDILDEMRIAEIKSYAIVDITPEEVEMVPK